MTQREFCEYMKMIINSVFVPFCASSQKPFSHSTEPDQNWHFSLCQSVWTLGFSAVAYAGKNFGGVVQGRWSGLVGSPGPEPCGRRRIFKNFQITIVWEILRKFCKFLMKFPWKIEYFSIFWENLLLTIESSEKNIIFLLQFFWFGEGGLNPPLPPAYTTVSQYSLVSYIPAIFISFPTASTKVITEVN